jgi:hypothetical protein
VRTLAAYFVYCPTEGATDKKLQIEIRAFLKTSNKELFICPILRDKKKELEIKPILRTPKKQKVSKTDMISSNSSSKTK